METIAKCNCGCETVVYRDKEIMIQSAVIDGSELVTHVDTAGFVNGKYSLRREDAQAVRQELEFFNT